MGTQSFSMFLSKKYRPPLSVTSSGGLLRSDLGVSTFRTWGHITVYGYLCIRCAWPSPSRNPPCPMSHPSLRNFDAHPEIHVQYLCFTQDLAIIITTNNAPPPSFFPFIHSAFPYSVGRRLWNITTLIINKFALKLKKKTGNIIVIINIIRSYKFDCKL